jgi:hypothetical protein
VLKGEAVVWWLIGLYPRVLKIGLNGYIRLNRFAALRIPVCGYRMSRSRRTIAASIRKAHEALTGSFYTHKQEYAGQQISSGVFHTPSTCGKELALTDLCGKWQPTRTKRHGNPTARPMLCTSFTIAARPSMALCSSRLPFPAKIGYS